MEMDHSEDYGRGTSTRNKHQHSLSGEHQLQPVNEGGHGRHASSYASHGQYDQSSMGIIPSGASHHLSSKAGVKSKNKASKNKTSKAKNQAAAAAAANNNNSNNLTNNPSTSLTVVSNSAGYATRGGQKKKIQLKIQPYYNFGDLDQPLPEGFELFCYVNHIYLYAIIVKVCPIHELLPSAQELMLLDQTNESNIVPANPPEAFMYDYAQHQYCYYVHFQRYDLRMDCWVTRNRLRLFPELLRFIVPYSLTYGATGRPSPLISTLLPDQQQRLLHLQRLTQQRGNHPDYTQPLTLSAPISPNVASHIVTPQILIPEPLPIYFPVPPILASNVKLMEQYEQSYEHAAVETIQMFTTYSIPEPIPPYSGPLLRVELKEEAFLYQGPDQHADEEHHPSTLVKNVTKIIMGDHELIPWYYSPYPSEVCTTGVLHLCDFCLTPFAYASELQRHSQRCQLRHPPGSEIYRSKETGLEICMFEVDGSKERLYCENLSYLCKMFLEHKALYEDCTIFLYYILCEITPRGCIIVGYFSKEKAWTTNNLACILTLPQHQGKSYGKFLISMSYELSKFEHRIGGPERPLTSFSFVAYFSYWTECAMKAIDYCIGSYLQRGSYDTNVVINNYHNDLAIACPSLLQCSDSIAQNISISIEEISKMCYIHAGDVVEALKANEILIWRNSQWILSLTAMKKIIQKQVDRREAAAARYAAMARPGIPQPIRPSLRYAVPSLIRWHPYNSGIRRNRRDFDDDEKLFTNTTTVGGSSLRRTRNSLSYDD